LSVASDRTWLRGTFLVRVVLTGSVRHVSALSSYDHVSAGSRVGSFATNVCRSTSCFSRKSR
jgi:hypothetical protein